LLVIRIALLVLSMMLGTAAAAFADDAPAPLPALRETLPVPVATEPAATALDRSAGQQWHRATLKLVGSMCPACLIGLEDKLKKMPGVTFAKVTRPEPQTEKIHTSRNASVVIIYDATGVRWERLIELIKKELYRPTDIKDLEY
jgi:hypothetical protein